MPPRAVPKTSLKVKEENINVSSSRRSNSNVQVEHISSATNAAKPKTSAKKSNEKKGYVIETIDASGNVVMKNGLNITNELKVENVTPISLSKYGRKIFHVNGHSTKEEKTQTPLPSSKVAHQSSFGRNIRKSSNQSDFSYGTKDNSQIKRTKAIKSESQSPSNEKQRSTPGSKRSRKQLDIGSDTSLNSIKSDLEKMEEVNLIQKSLIVQNGTSSPPSKKAKLGTSPMMTKSPRVTLSQMKCKTEDPTTPNQGKKSFDFSDPLAFSESSIASMNTPDAEDLEESFPPQGPYQCELCQNITDSKEEFVYHIRTKHLEDVDDGVMNTLYSDLKKARRKMDLAAINLLDKPTS